MTPHPLPSLDATAEQVRALTDRIASGDRRQIVFDLLRFHAETLNGLLAGRHAGAGHG